MAKKKERSEVEHLRGVIKNQRSIIKNLQKEVGRSRKRQIQEEFIANELLEDEFEEQKVLDNNNCPNCNKGKTEVISLGVKKMVVCNQCDYRKIRK